MGETCSTQRSALLKGNPIKFGSCAVHVRRSIVENDRLNEGRHFKDEYGVGVRLSPKVHSVRNKVTEATYVSYTLEKSSVPCKDNETLSGLIKRLQCLDHPNICRLFEAFDEPRKATVHLIYEKAIGMPLLKYVDQYGFSEENAANLIQQVARALKYGDEHGGVHHGAVAPKNIFVSTTGRVTMTDFGLAYLLKPSPLEGSREEDFLFLPPEALEPWLQAAVEHTDAWGRQKHVQSMSKPARGSKAWKKEDVRKDFWSSAADMWSLGVILFKVLTGHMPFRSHGKGAIGLANDIVKHKLDIKLELHDILSVRAAEVLKFLLHKSPVKRPSSEELLQHGWILKHTQATVVPLKKEVCKELSTFVSETHFKKMVMRLLVSKLPQRKLAALHKAFESMDGNRDGQVTLLELKRGLARFPKLCEGLAAPVEDVFAAIDIDQSGKVSLNEFLAATLDAHGVVTSSVIRESFRCLDTNGDGVLDREELAIAVREIDGHIGSSHVEDLVCKLEDELGPESLDLKGFAVLVKENGQRISRTDAVAKDAASQGWVWCPSTVCRPQAEKVAPESSERAHPGSSGSSPRGRRRSSNSGREYRSPKQSPKGSDAGQSVRGCSPGRRCSKSPIQSGRNSGTAGLRRLPHEDLSMHGRSRSPASSECSTGVPEEDQAMRDCAC